MLHINLHATKLFFVLIISLAGITARAERPIYSAVRQQNESWVSAYEKFNFLNSFKIKPMQFSKDVYASRKNLSDIQIANLTDLKMTDAGIQKIFEDIRNKQFLIDPDFKSVNRRISWLYPYDGCFARAEEVSHLLVKKDPKLAFNRVFIFGDLTVKTNNSTSGSVSWWYHVAVLFRNGNKAYIIDPSLEVAKPIELKAWASLMVSNPQQEAEFSICSSHAYEPGSNCNAKSDLSDSAAYSDISGYLMAERSNLIDLGRDPEAELGNNPPW